MPSRPRPLLSQKQQRLGDLKGVCNLCDKMASKRHPIVRGVQVCQGHYELPSSPEKLVRDGFCPNVNDSGACQGRGCQIGERRPCCVCGSDGNEGIGFYREEGPADKLTPCSFQGCRAFAHTSCRQWLGRRVYVYWDEDRLWYWGVVDAASPGEASPGCTIKYDDGEEKDEEDFEEMLRSGEADWLISPEARRWHGGIQPCVCHPFVAVQAAPIAEELKLCAVCCSDDTRLDELGFTNESALQKNRTSAAEKESAANCCVPLAQWCFATNAKCRCTSSATARRAKEMNFVSKVGAWTI